MRNPTEAKGFVGHYMNAFGTLEDMLAARDALVARALEAGVATAQGSGTAGRRAGGATALRCV